MKSDLESTTLSVTSLIQQNTMNSCSFPLFLFVIFLRCLSSTGAATCHPDDKAGLLAFKSGITQDPSGILSSWQKDIDCCSWYGIFCLPTIHGDRVTMMALDGNTDVGETFLSGTISPLLAKLHHLNEIRLTNLRKITGSFPHFLFKLPKLRTVYLENNRLSGPLPANIGALSNLEILSVAGNRFSGSIPSSMSKLTSLLQLKLNGNRLSGIFPDIFKSMRQLRFLDLSSNRFSGNLPSSIASLAPTLSTLEVGHNKLSGTIPDYLSRFELLSALNLSRNGYTGVVPMSFANLTNIIFLDLSHNLLTGPFPVLNSLGIEYLHLSYNRFHLETIPEWVTLSKFIYSLKLAKCGIKMSLDHWMPADTSFYHHIDFSENEISGSPIRFFNQMDFMVEFHAAGNKLQFDLGKLKFGIFLKTLDLSRNLVFGKVPVTVTRLQTLNLSQNHLCGKLPATKFPASAFVNNKCLCGFPLSPCKA
ncbi:putative leucine-rich repeat-containing, plant-type, leucine-rich repeat domain superfamily [Arabidopsis thaliana]